MNSTVKTQNNDLAFFGKVNASISHELKNIMAIISETAGLLNDLTEMATEGKKIEIEILKTCSNDIIEEIQRGFVTIKQMNTFSHSVDDPFKEVNLIEVLNLMIAISGFLSYACKVRFDHPEEDELRVLTSPIRLQNLIYQALIFSFKSAGLGGEIQVFIHPEKKGSVRITFSGLESLNAETFPVDKTKQIAGSIGTEILVNQDSQRIEILLPKAIEIMR